MENVLIFVMKWFVWLPIYICILIMPFYLFGALVYRVFESFRRASRAGAPKHSR